MRSGSGRAQVRRSRVINKKRDSTRFGGGISPPASPTSSDGVDSHTRSYSEVVVGEGLRPLNARVEKNGAIDLGFSQREVESDSPLRIVKSTSSIEYINVEKTGEVGEVDTESASLLDLAVFEDFEGTQPFFIGLDAVDKEDYDLLKALDVESQDAVVKREDVGVKDEGGIQQTKKNKKPGLMSSWLSRLVGSGGVSVKEEKHAVKPVPSPEPSDDDDILGDEVPSEFNQDGDARFSLDVEKKIYTGSHQKVADRSRPLHDQVIISNLMLYIISVHEDVTMNRSGKRAKRGRRAPGGKKRRGPGGPTPPVRKRSDLSRSVSPGRSKSVSPGRSKNEIAPVPKAQHAKYIGDASKRKQNAQAFSAGRKGVSSDGVAVVIDEGDEDVSAAIADLLSAEDVDEDDETPLGMLVKR
jgi:hypothetical protein